VIVEIGKKEVGARSTMLNEDYRDILLALSEEKVRFLLTGKEQQSA